jgi:membrane protease YdiL (CAAX protease family)
LADFDQNPPAPDLPPDLRPPAPEQSISDLIVAKASESAPTLFEPSAEPQPPQPKLTPAESAQIRYAYLPSALRVPWRWINIVQLVLLSIAGIFLLTMCFMLVYAALGHSFSEIQKSATETNYFGVILQAVLDIGILGYMLAEMRLRWKLPAWSGLGWHRLAPTQLPSLLSYSGLIFTGFVLSISISAAGALWPPKTQMPVEQLLNDNRTAILFMIMAVFVAPIVEETLFRGYLYPVAARSFGVPGGIFLTGLLFGLLHAGQLSGGPWLIILMVVVGSVLTWIRAKTGTVLASFIVHTAYNSLQVIALLITTHGLTKSIPHT